jgi:hypothetical protein
MYRPVFTKQPESWQEWWLAVRAFAGAWYGIATGDVTGSNPDVLALEQEIGLTISPSVHEWASFAADLRQAGIFEQAMRDDFTFGWDPGHDVLRLLTIAEGDVDWVVTREHLADEDPPVECRLVGGSDDSAWETWRHTPTTSEFVLQHLIAYLRHPGGGFSVDMEVPPELLDQLRRVGETSIELGRQTLIEGEDLLILVGESPFTQPDGWSTIAVEIGPSRRDSIPKVLSDLTQGRGGWFTGTFAEGMQT